MRRRIEIHQNMQEEQTRLKRAKVPNLVQAAKSQLLVTVKGREWSTIPSIYAQRLFMDHENNVATCVGELRSTKTCRRSKRASRVPKCQIWGPAAKSELLVAAKGRERSTIPSIYAQRLLMGHENIDATA